MVRWVYLWCDAFDAFDAFDGPVGATFVKLKVSSE